MKRVIAIFVLFSLILSTGCSVFQADGDASNEKPLDTVDADVSRPPTDNTSDVAMESGSDAAVPGSKINKPINLGKAEELNGYKVLLEEESTDDDYYISATVENTKYKLLRGFFVKAYLCCNETGLTCLVLCTTNEEINNTVLYTIDSSNEKLFMKSDSMVGELVSITGNTMKIGKRLDMLGTWYATMDYGITKKFKIKDPEENLWAVNAVPERNMTALCDIQAKEYDSGDDAVILDGSVLSMAFIDNDGNYAILKDIGSQVMYKLYVESDGYGGFMIQDEGAETVCFDNIQYSG